MEMNKSKRKYTQKYLEDEALFLRACKLEWSIIRDYQRKAYGRSFDDPLPAKFL